MKKKTAKRISILALVLSLLGIVLGAYLITSRPKDQTQNVQELTQENQQLRQQVTDLEDQLTGLQEQLTGLQNQLDQFMTLSSLKDWSLKAAPWSDSTGADVTLTATPTEYQPGMGATLLVMLGDRQAASVPCMWDGTVFTGTANLNAADGYSYFCLLSGPNGVQQLSLSNPDSEDAGIPVFLQSALSSYCNLVVHDWEEQNGTSLVLTSAYVQVQLPQIQNQELTITAQELVLRLNGQLSAKVPVKLYPSEVKGSYDATLSDLHLPMPQLEQDDVLELYLEVTLSDGRRLQAFGISWHLEEGQLTSSVG